ncbi:MAG: NUDIX domain-containing protein [Planctomycetes bacterium]|jgi:ADP-ribose pyrophosphatase YjhB (NUDIX family)|nr:NUDIX domain-containing protein [Planctomycetota bacterium]
MKRKNVKKLYDFCPKCGGSLELKETFGHNWLVCRACAFVFYQNSKPTVSTLIMKGDKLLLGKRSIEPSRGEWDVIGGFLEPGEHPIDGAKREAQEETGLKIEIGEMIGFYMDVYERKYPTLNICFLATASGGHLRPGDDIAELKWFVLDAIPKRLAFKNGDKMVADLKRRINKSLT